MKEATETILNEITRVFYTLFNNKDGQVPPVEKVHELFIPQGIIIKNVDANPVIYTLQQFIDPRIKLLTDGSLLDFSEEELTARTGRRSSGHLREPERARICSASPLQRIHPHPLAYSTG